MKTTIDLPDEILRRAKMLAAERSTTLKDLVIIALEEYMPPLRSDDKARRATLEGLVKKMQASNSEPMHPLYRDEAHDR